MKKILAILAACAVLAMLTGCDNKTNSDSSGISGGSDISDSSVISDSSNVSSDPKSDDPAPDKHTGEPTILRGLAGDIIYTDEIVSVFTNEVDNGGAELYDEDFLAVNCKDFIYLSEPSGLCYNDRDNADIYNAKEMSFTGAPDEPLKSYTRVNVGESFCGLTLRSASTNFQNRQDMIFFMNDGSQKTGAELGFPEIYFAGGECTFDGQLTLDGYACAVVEDVYGIAAGDIIFVPSSGCTLPVMSYRFDTDIGVCHKPATASNFGMVWRSEYGNIYLGSTETAAADISCLPDDGSFAKVRVTVENINMRSGVEFMDLIFADIVDIELAG